MEAGGGVRVGLGQLPEKGLPALPGVPRLQLGAQGTGPVKGGEGAAREKGINIQPRPPGEDGQLSTREHIVHTGRRHIYIPGGGEVLLRVGHVDHVVRDALHFLRRGFGGADVHAAVYLHGIGGHHLAVMALGQLRRQPGFSRGRGAGDD